jgi:hypothetical protein
VGYEDDGAKDVMERVNELEAKLDEARVRLEMAEERADNNWAMVERLRAEATRLPWVVSGGNVVMREDDVKLMQQLYAECRHLARNAATWEAEVGAMGVTWVRDTAGRGPVLANIRKVAKLVGLA